MKKLSLYIVAGLTALTAVSCDEDFSNWAEPQSFGQEQAVTIPGYTSSYVGGTIDLGEIEADSVQLFTLSSATLPEGYSLGGIRVVAAAADDATTTYTLQSDEQGRVAVADLQQLVEDTYGKRPTARSFTLQVLTSAVKNGEAVAIDAGTISASVIPEAPIIDSAYYLVGDMYTVKDEDNNTLVNGWDTDGMVQFKHSNDDVYSDPYFTITFTTTADGQYWKIIPQANVDAGDIWITGETGVLGVAVDGDTSMEGSLITSSPQAGKIEKAGTYVMTLNMMDYTYTITSVVPPLYIFGGITGWNGESALKLAMVPEGDNVFSFTGYVGASAGVKAWKKADFNNWDMCYNTTSAANNSTEASGTIEQSNGGAICAPSEGVWKFTMNLNTMTYTWEAVTAETTYESIMLIGGFNGWNASDTSADLTEVNQHNWYIHCTLSEASEVKFLANHDSSWKTNWGYGSGGDWSVSDSDWSRTCTNNGGNIYLPAGTWDVYLNDITGNVRIIASTAE